jgi:Fur family ferric uptake transcriptional regulator
MPNVEEIMERLNKEGCRNTAPRRLVVDEIVHRSLPFTSAELLQTVQRDAPGIGRATVFRTLELLCHLGIVQRIHEDAQGGRCHTYLACGDHHHHHLICKSCGTVRDFEEDKALDALLREVEQRTAFRIEDHRLELVGLCPKCKDES